MRSRARQTAQPRRAQDPVTSAHHALPLIVGAVVQAWSVASVGWIASEPRHSRPAIRSRPVLAWGRLFPPAPAPKRWQPEL